MNHVSDRHQRRSIRLQGYDYAQAGAYFVTICTQGRASLFGDVFEDEMRLNTTGWMVHAGWVGLPDHYAGVELDTFVVMPNHFHGIVVIADDQNGVGAGLKPARTGVDSAGSDLVGAGLKPARTKPAPTTGGRRHGLPEIVRGFKTFSARRINESRQTPGVSVWQRNYHEHIIRDEASLCRIREYILNNPLQWALDRENPLNIGATRGSVPARGEGV